MYNLIKKQKAFVLILLILSVTLIFASCDSSHSHHDSYAEITLEPTCTTDGEETWYCDCGKVTYTYRIYRTGHQAGDNGYCEVCDTILLEYGSNGDGTCSITDSDPLLSGDVILPDKSPDGDVVTSISDFAFRDCTGLTSIEIPSSVTSISDYAFCGCSGLTSIEIPSSVTSIGYEAFYDCSGLTSIEIPSSVTSIGDNAFDGCNSLKDVYINDIAAWCEIDFGWNYSNPLYNGANLYVNNELVTDLVIPEGVTRLGDSFRGCTSIKSIVIPDSVTSISDHAFHGCSGLTSIEIPSSVTSIGQYTFTNCSSLESITLPFVGANLNGTENTHFGYIFGGSNSSYVPSSLKSVVITGGKSIGDWAFDGCTGLTSVTIGNEITSIGRYAFEGCSGLASIDISSSVTSIGDRAFWGCSSLKDVYVNDIATWCKIAFSSSFSNPLYHGANLYVNNELVTELVIPESVTSISDHAFHGCSGLTSIEIPSSVTSIGQYTFTDCSSLESITLPFVGANLNGTENTHFGYIFGGSNSSYVPSSLKSVVITGGKSIGDYAFRGCTGLTSVTIGNEITSIGHYAFEGCSGLASVTIGNGITSIGNYAFLNCYHIAEVINYSSLTITAGSYDYGYIAQYALEVHKWNSKIKYSDGYIFYPYNNLIYYVACTDSTKDLLPDSYNGGAYAIKPYAFYKNTNFSKITIPDRVINIGSYAFSYCSSLESITIPSSVTSIGDHAFYGCSGLTSIDIPNSVTSIDVSAFENCSSLQKITLPFVGGTADTFEKYWFGYIFGATSYTGNATQVPKSLKKVEIIGSSEIASFAFYGCNNITEISISDTVTNIGTCAFSNCNGLNTLTIPFVGGSKTENTYIQFIFSTDNSIPLSLKNVIVTGGTEANFVGAEYIENLILPETLTKFYASHCSSLKSIHIPKNVVLCDLYECISIEEITVDNENKNYKSIDGNLYNKNGDTLLYYSPAKIDTVFIIPNGVTNVKATFLGCANLTELIIPASITSIDGLYADSLTKITVLNGNITYQSINGDLYSADGTTLVSFAKGKSEVTFAYSITTIGVAAFSGATKITEIVIPNTVTTIGSSAFTNCTNLEKVVIPDSVISIPGEAFYGSRNIKFYCEATTKPSGWRNTWYYGTSGNIEWGYYIEAE